MLKPPKSPHQRKPKASQRPLASIVPFPAKLSKRVKRRQKRVSSEGFVVHTTKLPAKPPVQPPKPETLRDCLLPLVTAATQVSLLAYQWGLENRQLMRASVVMDLCENVTKECEAMVRHEGALVKWKTTTPTAPTVEEGVQSDCDHRPNGPGSGPAVA